MKKTIQKISLVLLVIGAGVGLYLTHPEECRKSGEVASYCVD